MIRNIYLEVYNLVIIGWHMILTPISGINCEINMRLILVSI